MEDLIEKCFFSVGAAYRRSLFAEIGGYDEQAYGEDYDFWLRAMADGARHLYLPAPTAIHRLSATQKSASYLCSMSSDIRSIRAVLRSGKLTSGQRAVARRAIRDRKRVIRTSSEAVQLLGRVRRRVRAVVGRGDA
jgi:GT2 family glycosyltransferase